jgi:mono/diheme cytochrome c family protein
MYLTLLLTIAVMWGAILTPVAAEELDGSIAAPPPPSAGEAFAKYCAACHGVGGAGGAVSDLSKPAPDKVPLP